MEITVSGKHLEVTPSIRKYATDKTSKLPRYFDRVTLIEILTDKLDNHTFEVEVIVHAEHHDNFVGKAKGPDLYGCIDGVVDKLERQLHDFKEKSRNHKGHTPMAG